MVDKLKLETAAFLDKLARTETIIFWQLYLWLWNLGFFSCFIKSL